MEIMATLYAAVLIIFFVGITSANNLTRSYKGFWCDYNYECLPIIGDHSLCLANECQCTPHYHINYQSVCVRDKGLNETCASDDECYWGPEMVNKIGCSLGFCDCVDGYIPGPGRICIKYFSDSSAGNKHTYKYSPYIMMMILLVGFYVRY